MNFNSRARPLSDADLLKSGRVGTALTFEERLRLDKLKTALGSMRRETTRVRRRPVCPHCGRLMPKPKEPT